MSNMDRKTALEVLKDLRNPNLNYMEISGADYEAALDVAIHELEILCQKKPDREYYGQ